MKLLCRSIPPVLSLLLMGTAAGQWRSETFQLPNGWSALWLPGDASWQTVADHLANQPTIEQIWRWDAPAESIQFASSPEELFSASTHWAVWNRNDPDAQTLQNLTGQTPYLIRTTAPTTWTLRYRVEAPVVTWQVNGANLLGFPAGLGPGVSPTFQTYFSSLVYGGGRGLPATTRIFQYVGGDIVRNVNPVSVPLTTVIDPRKAYWITLPSTTDFTAPVEYDLPGGAIDFGRVQTSLPMGVQNRTSGALTLTLELETSEPAPSGQPAVFGNVPLMIRTFDTAAGQYVDTPVTGKRTLQLPASSTTDVLFALDRSQMSGGSGAEYASVLKLTDSANHTLSRLPVRAAPASAAGLWACLVTVGQVDPLETGVAGNATSRAFTLKYLVHIDDTGAMRLLRSCFLGQLKTAGNPVGIAVDESDVYAVGEAEVPPRRFFSSLLPAGQPVIPGDGPYEAGGAVSWIIDHAANDPVNPFRHTYHPDHPAGLAIRRAVRMEFTAAPPETLPNGASLKAAWGTRLLGGTYSETLIGLSKADRPLRAGGTFLMQRLSEIASLQLD